MATQTVQNRQVVAIFKDWTTASQAKETVQSAGLSAQKVSIDDRVDPQYQVAGLGTTVGGEAGLLMGAFYGGTLGVIFVTIVSTWTVGDVTGSSFNQLTVVAFTVAGAIFGGLTGKRFRMAELPAQKTVGNPDMPRRFQLVINDASPDEISQAQQALGQPLGQSV